jgi:predicted ATPase with chaperone activity
VAKKIAKVETLSKVRPDILGRLFGGMRGGRTASHSPTTETVAHHFTSGPLAERTDLNSNDMAGIVYLEWVAETYGVKEAAIAARIWKTHFISRDRMSRLVDADVIKAEIKREVELAKIDQITQGGGRERK